MHVQGMIITNSFGGIKYSFFTKFSQYLIGGRNRAEYIYLASGKNSLWLRFGLYFRDSFRVINLNPDR